MTLEIKKHFSAGWVALVISFIGAAGFYLWQPITDYFISGTFDENVILQIETDTLKSDRISQLLVMHIKIVNRDNVSATIKNEDGKGELQLQVRRIDKVGDGTSLDPEKLPLVTEKSFLKQYAGGYVIAPNAYYEEVESLALPLGNYSIKSSLLFDDGDYIDQVAVVRVDRESKK